MVKIILVSSLSLLLFACGNVKGKKLTREVWEQIKTGRELRGEEQTYLNAFIFTQASQDSILNLDDVFETGITVGEAIKEGKTLTIAHQKSLLRKPGNMTTKPADKVSGEVTN